MREPVLSILICSLHKRFGMLARLLGNLESQIIESGAKDLVEVRVNADGGEKSIGQKRNELLKQSKGRMVAFADDDDLLSECYVSKILKAAESNPDAIGINGTIDHGGVVKKWYISKDLDYCTRRDAKGNEYFDRYTNHLAPVKREIALKIGFPEINFAEDYDYAKRLHESGLIKTEIVIDEPMYHYRPSNEPKK
jgi:glycosyltransferase involved in cell wall biosynthesis